MQLRASLVVVVACLLAVTSPSAQTLSAAGAGDYPTAAPGLRASMPLDTAALGDASFRRVGGSPSHEGAVHAPAPAGGLAASRPGLLDELRRRRSLNIDRPLDQGFTMRPTAGASPVFARSAQAAQSTGGGGSPALKWLGVGMMGLGGLVGLDAADCASVLGAGHSACVRRLGFGGGLAAGGLYMFLANR